MRRILIAALLLALGGLAGAQRSVAFGGEVRTDLGVAVDGSLSVASAALELRASGEVGSGVLPDASFEAELVGSYDGATGAAGVTLGKAFATLYLGPLDLSAGQQIVAWGTTDAVSPVDVVNPRDLSFPAADPSDQRIPVPMLRATLHAPEDITVDAVVVPVFRASVPPGARWQTGAGPALQLPPGVQVVGQAPTLDEPPAAELANVQFGTRTTLDLDVLGGADVSVTYFHGIRTTPSASAQLVPTQTPGQFLLQPVLRYDRYDLLGVDASVATDWAVFRAEAAYTFTADPDGTVPSVANPGFQAVVEGERTFPSGALTQLELIVEHTRSDQGGSGETHASGLFTARYQPSPRVTTEASWLHDFSDGGGLLRPKLAYAFADGVTGTAELYVFYGPAGSRYGDWKDNTQIRLALAYAF